MDKVKKQQNKTLINQFKSIKASGNDITPEMLEHNIEWRVQMFATFSIHIGQSSYIPSDWSLTIIIPIYEKGEKSNPAKY